MDKEIKKRLLGKMSYSSDVDITYVPEAFDDDDIPEEYTLRFTLRSFTNAEKKRIKSLITKNDTDRFEKEYSAIIRAKIKNIENFWDLGKEEKVDYEADDKGLLKEEIYERIPESIISELSEYLLNVSGLSEAKKKQ